MQQILKFLLSGIIFFTITSEKLYATVTVTPAASGACLNIAPGGYTAIGTITVTENSNNDLAAGVGVTFILTAPTNFQFLAGTGGIAYTAGRNISAAAVVVTATTITVTLTVGGTNKSDQFQITNIQARATAGLVNGNILRLNPGGGTATVTGDAPGGGISHGYLSSNNTGYAITSAAAGNWNNTATWTGGIIPECNADVIINHDVTANVTGTVNNLTINSGGSLTSTSAITVVTSFTINGTGTYIHNNTSNAGTTIFAGTENFSPTSTINAKRWYNGNFPLAYNVNGDFGNVILNAGITWDQDGMFSPNRIKGSLTCSSGQIELDDGTGMTTFLQLQDVTVNGTCNLLVQRGANRNLTFITNNFTDTSASLYVTAIMLYSYGTLDWTCNGNMKISHDFSAIQGTGSDAATCNVNITGNLEILGSGLFDFNYLLNGPLSLTVQGSTYLHPNSSGWCHFIESNSQALTYSTTSLFVYDACTNNYLQGSTGSANITINDDFSASGTGTFYFTDQNNNTSAMNITVADAFSVSSGTVGLGKSTQPINCTINGNMTISGASTLFYGQFYGNGNSTTNLTVQQNVSISDGIFRGSANRGNMNLNVNGTFNQTGGFFYGIEYTTAGNWGIITANINTLNFGGGKFYLFDGRITDGRTITLNVTNNLAANFIVSADKFILVRGSAANNPVLNFTVGGNVAVSGFGGTSYFLTNAGSGNQTVNINGSLNISGGNLYFAGTDAPLGNPHNLTLSIGNDLNISGGYTVFDALGSNSTIQVADEVNISGGTVSIKWDVGPSTMNVLGNFSQTAGTFYFHNRNQDTPNSITMNLYGNFSQTGGTMNFDARQGNGMAGHSLYFFGSNFTIGGTGIIKHQNHLTGNTVFGTIYYNTNGIANYNRSSGTHDLQQVRQVITPECTLDASASANNLMFASHSSNVFADHTTLTVNGTLTMGSNSIFARQQAGYYAAVAVNSGGKIRTQHVNGFYNGSAVPACINAIINGSNNVNYSLDAASTIEYYGTDNQVITGIPNGIATGTQHKYGHLEINFQGTPDAEFVYPEATDKVYVRSTLLLTNGEFNLDDDHNPVSGGRAIIIENGGTIARTSGYIRSEVNDGSGLVKWNITATGTYLIPFGYSSTEYIPFTIAPTSGSAGDVSVATYHTAIDNTVYPPGIIHMNDLSGNDNSANTVDRFWRIQVSGSPMVDYTFTATSSEVGTIASPRAQRWTPANNGWEASQGIQSNPSSTSTLASGITGLGTWWTLAASASPLPVEMLSFSANCEKQTVKLKWATAAESNNNYFSIERSSNNISYSEIGRIPGAGTSTMLHNYQYTDNHPLHSNAYYRLRQVDFDGNSEIHGPVLAANCMNEFALQIVSIEHENNALVVTIHADQDMMVLIGLIDGQSRVLESKKYFAHEGINKLALGNSLPGGVYFIRVSAQDAAFSAKTLVPGKNN